MDRDDLGFLLAKATQRWNELLQERFRAAGWGLIYGTVGLTVIRGLPVVYDAAAFLRQQPQAGARGA